MTRRRMPSENALKLANDLILPAVHRQSLDRRPPHCGDADDFFSRPSEMVVPFLLTRVKQPRVPSCPRIKRRLPCSFSQRAVDAGQGEIFQNRLPAREDGHDMIQMKRGSLSFLGESAIFATMTPHGQPLGGAGSWAKPLR
jgi:hypothetical protein